MLRQIGKGPIYCLSDVILNKHADIVTLAFKMALSVVIATSLASW